MAEPSETMGEFTTPRSIISSNMMSGPGMLGGPRGMGVVFMDRSRLKGAGQNPLAGRYVDSPYRRVASYRDVKTYDDTYKETYELIKRKNKWLPRLLMKPWTTLNAIPRHLLRNSFANAAYNPERVVNFEEKFGNKM